MHVPLQAATAAIAGILMLTVATHAQPAASETEPKAMQFDSVVQPEAFSQVVSEHGGRVDFVFGEDRPFAQCHASTLAETSDGSLLCAWFGGPREKDPEVAIWLGRFSDGGWSAPQRVAKVNETAHWNPVLFQPPGDSCYLFFKVGPEIPFWQTYWMRSEDGGKAWTEPEPLVPGDKGGRGPVRNKPIVLSDGSWLAGASTEHEAWKPFADRSSDQGETWERSDDIDLNTEDTGIKGAIQPTLWESKPGHVHALMRTNSGVIARADSTDHGKTWSNAYDSGLPNNNSGIDLVQLQGNKLYLVYNPVGENWAARTPLTLALSRDNGRTWTNLAHFERDPEKEAEFSYPAIIETRDGIAVSYTWKRQRIRCWQIPMPVLDLLEEMAEGEQE